VVWWFGGLVVWWFGGLVLDELTKQLEEDFKEEEKKRFRPKLVSLNRSMRTPRFSNIW
jgi:hypothetical protein